MSHFSVGTFDKPNYTDSCQSDPPPLSGVGDGRAMSSRRNDAKEDDEKKRLDYVLRVGHDARTGMLRMVTPALPGLVPGGGGGDPRQGPARPNMPDNDNPNLQERREPKWAYQKVKEEWDADDEPPPLEERESVVGVLVDTGTQKGTYTGEMFNGFPDGKGVLASVVPLMVAAVLTALQRAQEDVDRILEAQQAIDEEYNEELRKRNLGTQTYTNAQQLLQEAKDWYSGKNKPKSGELVQTPEYWEGQMKVYTKKLKETKPKHDEAEAVWQTFRVQYEKKRTVLINEARAARSKREELDVAVTDAEKARMWESIEAYASGKAINQRVFAKWATAKDGDGNYLHSQYWYSLFRAEPKTVDGDNDLRKRYVNEVFVKISTSISDKDFAITKDEFMRYFQDRADGKIAVDIAVPDNQTIEVKQKYDGEWKNGATDGLGRVTWSSSDPSYSVVTELSGSFAPGMQPMECEYRSTDDATGKKVVIEEVTLVWQESFPSLRGRGRMSMTRQHAHRFQWASGMESVQIPNGDAVIDTAMRSINIYGPDATVTFTTKDGMTGTIKGRVGEDGLLIGDVMSTIELDYKGDSPSILDTPRKYVIDGYTDASEPVIRPSDPPRRKSPPRSASPPRRETPSSPPPPPPPKYGKYNTSEGNFWSWSETWGMDPAYGVASLAVVAVTWMTIKSLSQASERITKERDAKAQAAEYAEAQVKYERAKEREEKAKRDVDDAFKKEVAARIRAKEALLAIKNRPCYNAELDEKKFSDAVKSAKDEEKKAWATWQEAETRAEEAGRPGSANWQQRLPQKAIASRAYKDYLEWMERAKQWEAMRAEAAKRVKTYCTEAAKRAEAESLVTYPRLEAEHKDAHKLTEKLHKAWIDARAQTQYAEAQVYAFEVMKRR